MHAEADARVVLEIDLAQIRDNFAIIREAVRPLQVMAVLKANAYGLGVQPIAHCLAAAGADFFGVAELREALAIRHLGVPVLILGGLTADEVPAVVANGLVAPITDLDSARRLSAEAQRQGRGVAAHFLVDTGMGRLGILWEQAETVIRAACQLPGLDCRGLYSHFPHAYGDPEFSIHQVQLLRMLVDRLRADGIAFEHLHIANSDGINNIAASRRAPFTMVRTGINLYGVFDPAGRQSLELRPALRLHTRLLAARDLPAGSTLGYGQTFKLVRPMRIGTISIGYADGLPLGMSNRGTVLIRGRQCPIVGRVAMDYTTISLDACPEAEAGDEVLCLGGEITVQDWANYKGTIPYEIICSFGNRVARRYVNGDAAGLAADTIAATLRRPALATAN